MRYLLKCLFLDKSKIASKIKMYSQYTLDCYRLTKSISINGYIFWNSKLVIKRYHMWLLPPHCWRTLQCVISVTLLSDRHIAFMYCFEAIKWNKSLNYKKATLYNQTGQATRVSSRYYGLVYGVSVVYYPFT